MLSLEIKYQSLYYTQSNILYKYIFHTGILFIAIKCIMTFKTFNGELTNLILSHHYKKPILHSFLGELESNG